jgi:CRP-like cAMP-binding protein
MSSGEQAVNPLGTASATIRTRNQILARLDPAELARLSPRLEEVTLTFKEVFWEPGARVEAAYFIEQGVMSLITVVNGNEMVETGTIGNEGMAGLGAFLGNPRAQEQAVCQIAGRAKRMRAEDLQDEREHGRPLAHLLLRYTSATMKMLAQTAACNRLHPVEERMSRWLLMTLDRVGSADFPLTQEFLATMLGVRRPTVNIAGATLQKAGLIRYTRGKITVLDRAGLESASCECYAEIRDEFARALR